MHMNGYSRENMARSEAVSDLVFVPRSQYMIGRNGSDYLAKSINRADAR